MLRKISWLLVAVVAVLCPTVLEAQRPLSPALIAARTVYLVQLPGVPTRELDNAAKEINKARPRRLTLVDAPEKADLLLTLALGPQQNDGVVVIATGPTLTALPNVYREWLLTVKIRQTDEPVWTDHDVQSGDTIKRFVKRLRAEP